MSARVTRWITFDCYGTLVDWQAGFTRALVPFVGDKAPAVVRAYHAHERIVESEQPLRSYKDVLRTALARAADEQGLSLPASAAGALSDAWASMRPFDDVEWMLAELRQRGWRLAVLTNCDEDLFAVTHRMFRRPFDFVITAERIRGYKPARWHFRGFEQLMHVARTDWVHVACSHYHDIAPAQALGIQHVWLDRERSGEAGVADSAHVYSAARVVSAVEHLVQTERAPAWC